MPKAKALAQQFLTRIASKIELKTDPGLICKTLSLLGMDDFNPEDKNIAEFLNHARTKAIDVRMLVDRVMAIILEIEPFANLLGRIEEEQLISEKELDKVLPVINLQVNLLCLFEAFAATMANSVSFNEDVYKLIIQQRHTPMPGNPLGYLFFNHRKDASAFKTLKVISVDPAQTAGAFLRRLDGNQDPSFIKQEAKKFINHHKLALWNKKISPKEFNQEYSESVKNVAFNILEATAEDAHHGAYANACSGCGLIADMEAQGYSNRYVSREMILPQGDNPGPDCTHPLLPQLKLNPRPKLVCEFLIDKLWQDLYTSWNSYFVAKNFDPVFLIIKLLVPSVSGANPLHFLETRVFLLFLMGNLFHNRRLDSIPFFQSAYKFERKEQIFKLWGEFNQSYAEKLLNQHESSEKSTPELYRTIIGTSPFWSVANSLFHFIKDYEHFSVIPEETHGGCTIC
ncbi:symporter [Legionella birminghamensis]|uniref:Symporter n=1 Tax=Legionella birminghamensis TaxID=28083 RepID=A0A378I846_9GAMM|nr:hypothetical protein [Legionella birminghamensis]KTC67952.1 symporter [Legionella birminghamensis]STX31339.1 symporter [Legionella birminghamensis]